MGRFSRARAAIRDARAGRLFASYRWFNCIHLASLTKDCVSEREVFETTIGGLYNSVQLRRVRKMTKVIVHTTKKYRVDVPVRVIYRLESDKTVVKQEDGTMPISIRGDQLLQAQEEADRAGITLEHFFLEFVIHIYRERLPKDKEDMAELKSLVKKYKCNILTEVKLNGQIEIQPVSQDPS
jgi:hypothetical protein